MFNVVVVLMRIAGKAQVGHGVKSLERCFPNPFEMSFFLLFNVEVVLLMRIKVEAQVANMLLNL